jgi:hypothetical protein
MVRRPRQISHARRARAAAWLRALAALAALALAGSPRAVDAPGEYDVKAAMLLNVLKFVEWPASAPTSELGVCVLGAPRFARAIAATAERAGTKLVVTQPRSAAGGACQVVVLGRDYDGSVEELSGELARAGVLTVADSDGYGTRGVQVNFFMEDGRVRLEVNLDSTRRARLRLSSKLLRLARVLGSAS